MSMRVVLADPLDDVPAEVRSDLLARLNEVAASLEAVPKSSMVWDSIALSGMQIDVGSWRFHYGVDRDRLIVWKASLRK
jgi:hypothetical protein